MMKLILLTVFSIATLTLSSTSTLIGNNDAIVVTDGYKKVDSSELTPQVVEQILKEYPTSKLAGVYKNNRGQFKLIMILQSGSQRTVYIDQYGRWFKPKK